MTASSSKKKTALSTQSVWVFALFVTVLSFFTYAYNYQYPAAPFWDEPYHIASAEKYLSGVFFMEQHPPLGKMLIAFGEMIVNGNSSDSEYIGTDYATNIPDDFSYAGMRLLPTLLGWLSAIVLFSILLIFTRNAALSTILSFLYVFDNAQIVHSRGAMVDSPLTFFGLLTLLLVLLAVRSDSKKSQKLILFSLLAGASFGAVMTTKLVGLIFILAFVWGLWMLRKNYMRCLLFTAGSLVGFVIVFISVWHLHFSLGTTIEPRLSNEGFYHSSEEAKSMLVAGTSGTWQAFPTMLADAMAYVPYYSKGVPKLDLCKDHENGSPSFFWPIGAKTINYRWATDGEKTRYLYLVPNPVGWALGFFGVLACSAFALCSLFLHTKLTLHMKNEMMLLLAMYWGYMFAISQLDRVMYLYHYFVPLNISYLLFAIFLLNITRVGAWTVNESRRFILATLLALAVFLSFQYYRPFSYYKPISDENVAERAILPLWELRCAKCTRESSILNPNS